MRFDRETTLVLDTIRAVVGDSGMEKLYLARNGSEIFIPLRVHDDHWMAKLFGVKNANEICKRLTVFNADGRSVCNLRAYVTNGKNRLQTFQAAIKSEVTECLLSGKGVKETAIIVGVSERTVRNEFKSLCDVGLLERPKRSRSLPATSRASPVLVPYSNSAPWDVKAALVDEALLSARPTGRISVAVGVSRGYVRIRRKMLEAAGKLKAVPRFGAPASGRKLCDLAPAPSPDHSANVGGMVVARSDEVSP